MPKKMFCFIFNAQTIQVSLLYTKLMHQVCKVELVEGDTIIMGSDGLFDNVFDHEMVSIIASCTDVSEAGSVFLIDQVDILT